MSVSNNVAPFAGNDSPAALTQYRATLPVQERRLQKVLEMIESEPLRTIRELAVEVHLSPTHLQRLFKHETGVDVSELLAEHRLQRAAHLLCVTDMQIKEIAYAAGYEHHSSFVRAFQRRFALTPRSYRQRKATALTAN